MRRCLRCIPGYCRGQQGHGGGGGDGDGGGGEGEGGGCEGEGGCLIVVCCWLFLTLVSEFLLVFAVSVCFCLSVYLVLLRAVRAFRAENLLLRVHVRSISKFAELLGQCKLREV